MVWYWLFIDCMWSLIGKVFSTLAKPVGKNKGWLGKASSTVAK